MKVEEQEPSAATRYLSAVENAHIRGECGATNHGLCVCDREIGHYGRHGDHTGLMSFYWEDVKELESVSK